MMTRFLFKLFLIVGLCLAPAIDTPSHAYDLDDLKKDLEKAKKKNKEAREKAEKEKAKLEQQKKKVDQAQGKISTEEEIEIGGNLISGLLGAASLVDDPELQRYVNDVGFWVASQSRRKELPWSFGVIKSDGINAFAAPGGFIVVTLGLYSLLENEAQLAAVLAHEIGHVVRKHHLKALQKTMKREFWSDLGIRAVSDKKDREEMRKLINAGVQLYATGLDREYEYDADLHGVVLAARAGYDPFALLDVLTTIDSINPESEELSVLMNTHPPTADRLDRLVVKMDGAMDQYASGQSNSKRFRQLSGSQ